MMEHKSSFKPSILMDLSRVAPEFDADKVTGEIAIVGVGAIGSRFASYLNDVGLGPRLVLYDGDVVEQANLSSQEYDSADIGTLKAEALQLRLSQKWTTFPLNVDSAIVPKSVPRFVTAQDRMRHQYVIGCLDGMAKRRMLAEKCVFLNGTTQFLMDARITAREIIVVGYDPRDPKQHRQYLDELYDDPPPDVLEEMGGCRITPSIAPTAGIAAALQALLLFDFINGRKDGPNELAMNTTTWTIQGRRYARSV